MGFGYSPSLFQMAGNMVNSFWYGKDMSQKQRDEIRKQELYHSVYYSKSKEVALKIINEFSVHFACFCLNPTDIMDILNEISDEYNIKGEEKRLKYLVAKINSNMYSIKNSKFKKLNLEKNEKNINNNGNKNYFSEKFLNKNYLKRKIGKVFRCSIVHEKTVDKVFVFSIEFASFIVFPIYFFRPFYY